MQLNYDSRRRGYRLAEKPAASSAEVNQSRPVFLGTVGRAEYYLSVPDKKGERELCWRAAKTRKAIVPASEWKLLTADYPQIEIRIAAELSKGPRLTATLTRTQPRRRRKRSYLKQAIQTISSDVMRLALHKVNLALHAGTPDGGRLRGAYFMLSMPNQIIMVALEDQAESAAKIMKDSMLAAYNIIINPVTVVRRVANMRAISINSCEQRRGISL